MLRILLAEDNTVNQKVIIRLLQTTQPCCVALAENGVEAVSMWKAAARGEPVAVRPTPSGAKLPPVTRAFHLVLMDCQMPEMDGQEATRQIRALEPDMPGGPVWTPIIALTAHALQSDKDSCMAAGMSDYVTKPIDIPKFTAALERAMLQRREWGQEQRRRKQQAQQERRQEQQPSADGSTSEEGSPR
jgi:CheY-like chemotaxis protein